MILEINGNKHRLGIAHLVYFVVLFLFSAYAVTDLSYNTAFVDEAIYATVGEEFMRGIFWENALSWMGGSYFYPLLSALINRVYGLAGIRAFSFLCLFVAGVVAGELARSWGGKVARIVATMLFFSSSAVLSVSSLGTYDAPAILFLSLSVVFAFFSTKKTGRERLGFIVISSLAFFASFMAKYVTIIFFPFIPMLLLEKESDARAEAVALWLLPFLSGFLLYLLFALQPLINFFTSDSFTEILPRLELVRKIIEKLNIFLLVALALPALVIVKPKYNYYYILLFLTGSVPLGYHFLSSNFRSLGKHVVFTEFFWAPVLAAFLAYILAKLRRLIKNNEVFSNASLLIYAAFAAGLMFILWSNLSTHWRFKRSWPSASTVLAYLSTARKPTDKIFAEGSAVYKYHLFDGFEDPFSWTSTWYAEYKGQKGLPAMRKAIEEEAFDFIILNGYYTNDVSRELTELANIHYEKVLTDIYKVSGEYDTPTFVWVRKTGN